MSTNNVLSPQQLVQRIAQGYGWISQRAREASDQEALDAIDMLQENLGIAVRTYVCSLSKGSRQFYFNIS